MVWGGEQLVELLVWSDKSKAEGGTPADETSKEIAGDSALLNRYCI